MIMWVPNRRSATICQAAQAAVNPTTSSSAAPTMIPIRPKEDICSLTFLERDAQDRYGSARAIYPPRQVHPPLSSQQQRERQPRRQQPVHACPLIHFILASHPVSEPSLNIKRAIPRTSA